MRTIGLFLLVPWLAFALPQPVHASPQGSTLEKRIMSKILRALTPHRQRVRVYYYGGSTPAGLRNNDAILLTSQLADADVVVLGSTPPRTLLRKIRQPILVLEYGMLRHVSRAVGAYFWQKGRPNIIMIRSRLSRAGIRLPAEFDRYIENTLW